MTCVSNHRLVYAGCWFVWCVFIGCAPLPTSATPQLYHFFPRLLFLLRRPIVAFAYCRSGHSPQLPGIPEGIIWAPESCTRVVDGIRDGFRTGFVPDSVSLVFAWRNMLSASEHPSVIDSYLALEVSKSRVSGPSAIPPISGLQCNPFGVIPRGHSVNDGISRERFSLRCISVDTAITSLMELGPGALMAKFDVGAALPAYRNIPIHESEQYLLGMQWCDQYYVDLTLPFGLRSAPTYLISSPPWSNGSCGSYSITWTISSLSALGTPGVRGQCHHRLGSVRAVGSSPPSRQVHWFHDVSRFSGH